jgi:hypothetical protein
MTIAGTTYQLIMPHVTHGIGNNKTMVMVTCEVVLWLRVELSIIRQWLWSHKELAIRKQLL